MSATLAHGAAPPEAADVETTVATTVVDREEEEEEQKVAKNAKEEIVAELAADDTADMSDEDTVVAEEVPPSGEDSRPEAEPGKEEVARREAATRVRQSAALPPGLRERLATLVEAGGQVGGDGQALVSIDEAIRAVAESLPGFVRLRSDDVARPEHPSGEAFFSGRSAEEITDQQAEEMARGQLARSGLLRGQRVRVAD